LQNRTFFLEALETSVIPLSDNPPSRPTRLPHTFRLGLQAGLLSVVIPLTASIASLSAGDAPVAPKKASPVAPAQAGPTGSLVLVGGGSLPDSVRLRFIDLAGGKKARLVVIPTASEWGHKTGVFKGFELWKGQSAASVTMLHTLDRKKANDPAFIKPLTEATGVWISGGDQARLTAAYSGTAVERELRKMLTRGGVIGGTSAGAAAMSSLMIVSGNPDAKVGTGLGLLGDVVIDQHFRNRNRLKRLQGVLDRHPDHLGLGIDEETAVVVQGHKATVLGNANVSLCLPAALRRLPAVQVFKSGDIIDLSPFCQAVQALGRPAPAGKR
jgi:cyanophycinase